jgi:hypothetical protein
MIILAILATLIVVAFIIALIVFLNKATNNTTEPIKQEPKRRYVKDVKPGESITIEWYRIASGIGSVTCLSNDSETKKILLQVKWSNYKDTGHEEYEKFIVDYNDEKLANFHLLNSKPPKQEVEVEDDNNIASLQKKMNEALDKEEYEKANDLQKKIDKLLKK